MSIIVGLNIWWLELEAIFADIPYQKPNITQVAIN
jgi:hypothetical protein